jgi:hypothetical protein
MLWAQIFGSGSPLVDRIRRLLLIHEAGFVAGA